MYESEALLQYSRNDEGYKLIALLDPGITNLARALLPKNVKLNRQKYPPHITVVRNEQPPDLDRWGAYQDTWHRVTYDPYVFNDEMYYWLKVFCPFFYQIRLELGLPFSYVKTRPPDGVECFHTTIGNLK